MKLWILSDLHRDFEDWAPFYVPDADVAVVAGDVGEGLAKSIRWLHEHVAPHMPVVFVAGNHEFYRAAVDESFDEARSLQVACPDVNFLEDESVVIGGVRFVGSTLWTDYEVLIRHNDPALGLRWAMDSCALGMNDHRKIKFRKDPWKRWRPQEARIAHLRSRAFIEQALSEPHRGPTVVVTHHAPHPASIPERFAEDVISSAYASDLSAVIEAGKPDLWVHGHMHDSVDYDIGSTRVVCNPKGYSRENAAFVADLVVDTRGREFD